MGKAVSVSTYMSSFCVKHGGHAIKYGKVLFSDMEIASTTTTVGGTKLWYYGGLQLSLSAFYGVSTTSNKVYPIRAAGGVYVPWITIDTGASFPDKNSFRAVIVSPVSAYDGTPSQ